jgi:DNA processing protein
MLDDALYYNAVAVACGGDRGKMKNFWRTHGDWEYAWHAITQETLSLPGTLADPQKEWEKLTEKDVRFAPRGAQEYPPLFRELFDPPFGIYIRGAPIPRDLNALAVVGTRRATPDGRSIAKQFARELAANGIAIVSGLAFGVDAAAHEGCLEAGGRTIAVLAGGLADIYPRNNARLAEKILAAGGSLISEYPLEAPPYPLRFLERNRLVSGLARGTLIVEAPFGSGSLVTARHAMEANRDVFVVPGPITQNNFSGSNQLIRQGAELVTAAEEILDAYGVAPLAKSVRGERTATDEEKLILNALRAERAPADVDKIINMTKLEPRVVNRSLSFLLLRGAVVERNSGYTINT